MKSYLINIFSMPEGKGLNFVASVPVTKKDLAPRAFVDFLRIIDLEKIEEEAAPVFRALDYPNEGFDPRVLVYSAPGTHFLCKLCLFYPGNGAMKYTDFVFHFINPSPLKSFAP